MKKGLLFIVSLFSSTALFADEGAQTIRGQNPMSTFLLIGIALLFFYFILFRPEQKRRKKMEQQRNSIVKGDKVTAVGIIGTVDEIRDSSFILKMVDGAKIEVVKAAISEVQPQSQTS